MPQISDVHLLTERDRVVDLDAENSAANYALPQPSIDRSAPTFPMSRWISIASARLSECVPTANLADGRPGYRLIDKPHSMAKCCARFSMSFRL